MSLIFSTMLTQAVSRYYEKLGEIGLLLTIDHDQERSKEFENQCRLYNTHAVNHMIENALRDFLDYDNIQMGLVELVKKFPELNINLDDCRTEASMIKKISENTLDMLKIVESEGYK